MKRFVFTYLAHLAFAAAALVLVLFGWALVTIDGQSKQSTRLVSHTLEAIRGIDDIDAMLSRAESAQRGYLLSDRTVFMAERDQALGKVHQAVAGLRLLLSDNPVQQQRLAVIDTLIGDRIRLMQESMDVVRDNTVPAEMARSALELVAGNRQAAGIRQQAQARLDGLMEEIKQEELRLLGLRRSDEYARHQNTLLVLSAAVLVSLAILLPGCIGFAVQARARERAERKLSNMADSLPGAVYQCRSTPADSRTPGFAFEFLGQSLPEVFGVEREALLRDGAVFWNYALEGDHPALHAALLVTAQTLEPLRHDFRIRHGHSGEIRWIRSTASVQRERDGSLLWNGYWSDITERKRLERVEQDSHRDGRYRGLLEAAPDAMVVVNPAGEIVILNVQAENQFGYSRDELLGQPVKNIIPEGFAERLIADGTRSAAEALAQQIGTGIELSARRKDGSVFPIEIMLSPLDSSEGILVTAAIRDISVRKEAELQKEAAEASNRAKSVFLATMSHEIRTPMNGLLGLLELLSLTQLDAEQHATLDVVRESGKSLQRIIDDILDFSKIEAGKLDVRPEPSAITQIVAAVRNIYSGNASDQGVLLKSSVDPDISPVLMVDPMRLRQILNNLVSNALKFTTKGHIDIKAELLERCDGEERLRFSVSDTGIGISAENQALLFQPFVQVGGEVSPRFGGTGLGLTICQRLARMMGGSITMHSELGVGTTMTLELSLPIGDPDAVHLPEPVSTRDWLVTTTNMRRLAPDIARARAEGTLVLLADDHPTNRSLMVRQVNLLGYAAQSAENGVEALAMWKAGRFGILITDGNMPEMDGYELARCIRQHEAASGDGTRMPIVACTANVLGGEAEICLAAGMDDYLPKPVELKELAKKLDKWLPIPRSAPALDRAALAAISGGDAAMERDILIDFRRVNNADVALLEVAVDSSDMPDVLRTLHRIKGASRMVGAMALARVCEHLEHDGASSNWKRIETDMEVFQCELERLNTYFEDP